MICANCGEREGTVQWYGSGGALAFSHGFYKMWCRLCVVQEQLAFAKAQAERIPGLQEEFRALRAEEAERNNLV